MRETQGKISSNAWIVMVESYVPNATTEQIFAIADRAACTINGREIGVYHAAWEILSGREGHCPCTPCQDSHAYIEASRR